MIWEVDFDFEYIREFEFKINKAIDLYQKNQKFHLMHCTVYPLKI